MSVLRGGRRTEGGGHGPENRQGASDRKEERRGGCAARLTRSNTLPAPTRTRPTLAGFLGVLPASAPNRVIPSRPVPAHTTKLTSPRSLSPSQPRVCASPPNPRPSNEPHSTRTSPAQSLLIVLHMLQTPHRPGPPFPAIAREDSEDNKKCSHRLMVNKFHRSSARDAVSARSASRRADGADPSSRALHISRCPRAARLRSRPMPSIPNKPSLSDAVSCAWSCVM